MAEEGHLLYFRGGPGRGVAEEGVHFIAFQGRAGRGRGGGIHDAFSRRAGQRAWRRKIWGPDGGRRRRGDSVVFVFRSCTASQINLGCLETYRASGRLVITLLQGGIRVMRL